MYTLKKLPKTDKKKYVLITPENEKILNSDFTLISHKDEDRKDRRDRYINRHNNEK